MLELVTRNPNANPILQVILFDPFDIYDHVKKSFGAYQMRWTTHRDKILSIFEDCARNMDVSGVETWWGGVQNRGRTVDGPRRSGCCPYQMP